MKPSVLALAKWYELGPLNIRKLIQDGIIVLDQDHLNGKLISEGKKGEKQYVSALQYGFFTNNKQQGI